MRTFNSQIPNEFLMKRVFDQKVSREWVSVDTRNLKYGTKGKDVLGTHL